MPARHCYVQCLAVRNVQLDCPAVMSYKMLTCLHENLQNGKRLKGNFHHISNRWKTEDSLGGGREARCAWPLKAIKKGATIVLASEVIQPSELHKTPQIYEA